MMKSVRVCSQTLLHQRRGVSFKPALQRPQHQQQQQHHHRVLYPYTYTYRYLNGYRTSNYNYNNNNNNNNMLMLKQYKTTMTKRTTSTSTVTATATATVTATVPVASAVTITAAAAATTNFARRAWNAYTQSLNQRPLLTKAVVASIIFFTSDSATQYLVYCNDNNNNKTEVVAFEWNAARALSGASFGIIATTWLHYWWGFLETAVVVAATRHKIVNTACKVILDQAIGAPLYIYSYYVLTNLFLVTRHDNNNNNNNNSHHHQHHACLTSESSSSSSPSPSSLWWWWWWDSWKQTNDKAANMLWPTMLQHWRVWVPVHSLNFYFTPLHHRVLVQNTVLVFWSAYLSHLNHQDIVLSPAEEMDQVLRQQQHQQPQQQQEETMTKTTTTTTTRTNATTVMATTTTSSTTAKTE